MPVNLVPESSYQQLLDSLQSAAPKSLSIIGSLRNVLRGRLKANFYVDQWPDYKAVVCQYIWPRRSDVADIGAYATSSEALLSVLTEEKLVTWGKRQEFQRLEARHADYLVKHLRPPGTTEPALKCVSEQIHVHYHDILGMLESKTPVTTAIDQLTNLLPEGYIIGKLQPHHAEMVTSQWPRLHGWPNKEPYFRELLSKYHCPAAYSIENLDEPASYVVQFPCHQTFGYTNEKHTGQRLVSTPGVHSMIFELLIDGFVPGEEEVSQAPRVPIYTDIGCVLSGYNVKDLVTIQHCLNAKL